jgi:uncharacterized protein (TIGR02265 family)
MSHFQNKNPVLTDGSLAGHNLTTNFDTPPVTPPRKLTMEARKLFVDDGNQTVEAPEAVGERLNQTSQRDVIAGMFFSSTIEEITRAAGPSAAERACQQALGRKKSFEAFFRYPVGDLLKLIDAGARSLGASYASALTEFGRAAARAFLNSPAGRTMMRLGGKDPHRLLFTLASGNQACASFGARTYERTGANSALIRYSAELLGPSWIIGSLQQAFESFFHLTPDIRVEAINTAGTNFTLTVRW